MHPHPLPIPYLTTPLRVFTFSQPIPLFLCSVLCHICVNLHFPKGSLTEKASDLGPFFFAEWCVVSMALIILYNLLVLRRGGLRIRGLHIMARQCAIVPRLGLMVGSFFCFFCFFWVFLYCAGLYFITTLYNKGLCSAQEIPSRGIYTPPHNSGLYFVQALHTLTPLSNHTTEPPPPHPTRPPHASTAMQGCSPPRS